MPVDDQYIGCPISRLVKEKFEYLRHSSTKWVYFFLRIEDRLEFLFMKDHSIYTYKTSKRLFTIWLKMHKCFLLMAIVRYCWIFLYLFIKQYNWCIYIYVCINVFARCFIRKKEVRQWLNSVSNFVFDTKSQWHSYLRMVNKSPSTLISSTKRYV
jgi:hypothetical protein